MRRLPALLAASLCSLAVLAPAAAQASGSDVLRDCELHDHLTKQYSQSDYRSALSEIAGDQGEYSDCQSIIKAAQAAAARASGQTHAKQKATTAHAAATGGSSGGSSSSGGGSKGAKAAPASHGVTAADRDALHRAQTQSSAVALPGGSLSPSTASAADASGLHAMPVPLRIVLILLAAGAVLGVGLGVRRRVLDRRSST